MATENDNKRGVASNRSVSRAIDVLRALAGSAEPLTVTEIAKRISLPRATAFRLVSTLEEEGIVDRQETLYRLGWDLTRIAQTADPAIGLGARVGALLQDLADSLGNTVTFSLRYGVYDLQMLLQYIPTQSGYAIAEIQGTQWPLYASSTGKLLLADFSEDEVHALTHQQMKPLTDNTITDPEQLAQELDLVRERGWATNISETEDEIFSIAVPIRDRTGSLTAALAVVSPLHRSGSESEQKQIAEEMLRSAGAVQQRLVSLPG